MPTGCRAAEECVVRLQGIVGTSGSFDGRQALCLTPAVDLINHHAQPQVPVDLHTSPMTCHTAPLRQVCAAGEKLHESSF